MDRTSYTVFYDKRKLIMNAVLYILSIRPDSKDVKSRILLGAIMLFHAYMGVMDLQMQFLETQDMECPHALCFSVMFSN